MTTTIMQKTVGVDFIITTPAQLAQAFLTWNKRVLAQPEDFDGSEESLASDGAEQAVYLIEILKELNGVSDTNTNR